MLVEECGDLEGPRDLVHVLQVEDEEAVSAEERKQYLARSPYNVARLILPDSPDDAARLWRDWRTEGVLVGEAAPALWWLREDYEGPDGNRHRREGFFGLVRVEPYERGIVRPHERTHAAARRSQLELLRAVRANLSPILLLYDDPVQRPRKSVAGSITPCTNPWAPSSPWS